jgi:hypothetical protein
VPEAFVTKGRQRVKQYNQNVFLKNGDEFELELFNPKTDKVLAKIKLNGKYISSSGIVLRPGERVFLERYLDEAKKFQFETYEVDGNDPNTQRAIQNNGDVEVEFYDEIKISPITVTWTYNPSWTYYSGGYVHPTLTSGQNYKGMQGPIGASGSMGISGHSNSAGISSDNHVFYCATNPAPSSPAPTPVSQMNSLETGRVEKGDFSNQNFNTDYSSFNSWCSTRITWKIIPESRKPLVVEDLKVFCTNCGAKRKKPTHKFCPNCGTQF